MKRSSEFMRMGTLNSRAVSAEHNRLKLLMRLVGVAVKVKRVYDQPAKSDGLRVLVDRIWPRGLKKSEARIDKWLREIAPSTGLRKWFKHDPRRWEQFKKKYAAELEEKREEVDKLAREVRRRSVTLVFSAKDTLHNNALALKEYIEQLI